MKQIDLLINHPHLVEEVAWRRFLEFGHLVPDRPYEAFLKEMQSHFNVDCLPLCYVCLEEGQFAGTFSLRVSDLKEFEHLTPWFCTLIVPLEKRRQGIGAMLVKEGEKQAKEMGYKKLYLHTVTKAPFYQKLGWEKVGETHLNTLLTTVMVRNL